MTLILYGSIIDVAETNFVNLLEKLQMFSDEGLNEIFGS